MNASYPHNIERYWINSCLACQFEHFGVRGGRGGGGGGGGLVVVIVGSDYLPRGMFRSWYIHVPL